ncbi:his Kinase A domain protein [Lyngbya aestuarii BL J]|mgnify:CR=1 FL=1|uniref:histidine kinase n=2 Tax=Lyngbya aestuarii BL J TaxID=1348334 RepID=U7Q855_9CYAN|nr:hybrid sensor histidine kinase/response regulator [Lyngbya aestuarii]ERT03978.1 his Kinase A domain protein [Lyngbya aestuarii BL J]
MYSCPTHLQTFIRAVPVCHQTTTLSEVWSIFCQEKCDRIVVISPQDHPLGVVYLCRLIGSVFPPSDSPPLSKVDDKLEVNPQQSINDLDSTLIEPLIEVSAHLNWEEFWQYLHQTDSQTQSIALVNRDHQFIGLLDSLKLLQFVVSHPHLLDSTPTHTPDDSDPNAVETVEDASSSSTTPSLLQLIEQLPIPLMIQQENGETLAQNQAWRSQVELDPQYIRKTPEPSSSEPVSSPEWIYSHSPTYTSDINSSDSSMSAFPEPSVSQEGTASVSEGWNVSPDWSQVETSNDTYVCVCSLPNGRERVWQFVRQPLPQNWAVTLSWEPSQLWIVIAQEITEQHRVAQELAAKNADLVQLNRLKDEFLACISHELKTPLTAVLGLSSLLKDQALGSLNDRQARYAKLIHQSGRHLMMVVNDILDLTRMETGQLELIPEPVQIRAICERAFQIAGQHHSNASDSPSPNPPKPQERFILDIEPSLETIVADELRLRQMLVNLLSNALKFTPDDSQIGLQVSYWENWIGFTIWDKGIGIPEDKQHLIFQKFQQLESPLTRKFEGTGLGLVLTQRLARLHGGDVSFISKQDQGSQFTLLLPPSPPQRKDWGLDTRDWQPSHHTGKPQGSPVNPPRPTPEIQSRLILIVEAAPRYIFSLSEQLTNLGYRVVIARSGTEALEKARCLQPRVIFLNPLLPLLSGWDVLTLLKTNTHTHQIPVVITATLGDKKRAQLNNCDGFLSLPVEKQELQKILTELKQDSLLNQTQRLTLLWLNPIEQDAHTSLSFESQNSSLNAETVENSIHHSALILHHFSSCRILEADDLNQAELLARIWHPDAVILQSTTGVKDPSAFLHQLSQHEILVNLPLITLDQPTTKIANQIEPLSVFPCLAAEYLDNNHNSSTEPSQTLESALLQVVQVAVGMNWKPNILLVDFSVLPDFQPESSPIAVSSTHSESSSVESQPLANLTEDNSEQKESPKNRFKTKIDRALVQYLQTAGFRGLMAQSWPEVLQHVQYKSIDLLLICTRDLSPALLQVLSTLEQISTEFPILILNQSNVPLEDLDLTNDSSEHSQQIFSENLSSALSNHLRELIKKLEITILPGQISMSALLEQIKQVLHENTDKESL